jgi:hypothetical protein
MFRNQQENVLQMTYLLINLSFDSENGIEKSQNLNNYTTSHKNGYFGIYKRRKQN